MEPELTQVNTSLTIAELKAHPKELIYDWADSKKWTWSDKEVHSLVDAGLEPLIEIGEGTYNGLPRYSGTIADPSVIGVDLYLAYQYRFGRAAARRYKGKARIWQIENELNEAFLSGFMGQRLVAGIWGNWTFLTTLLHTLKDAVRAEIPDAHITMNFHTDVPKIVHEQLDLPGYYEDAVQDWASVFSILSFDAYPCMYIADPQRAFIVGDRLEKIKQAAKVNETGMKVFVMETGYPVDAPGNHPPDALLNFSDHNQAIYIRESVKAVKNRGGHGYFFFKLVADAGMTQPPGGYTPEDESMFAAIRNFLITKNETALIEWLLEPGDLEEAITRASKFMSAPGNGWGLLDQDNTKREGFYALRDAFAGHSVQRKQSMIARKKHPLRSK